MKVKVKDKIDINIIIEELKSSYTNNKDGSISYSGMNYSINLAILKSVIFIEGDISAEMSNKIIGEGISKSIKNKCLDEKSIIAEINKSIRTYASKPLSLYYLVTTFNIKSNISLPRIKVKNCNICFYDSLPKKYRSSRKAIIEETTWNAEGKNNSIYVVGSISEKDELEAVQKILFALDLLRAIWNLQLNNSMEINFFSGFGSTKKKAINKIALGPIHTIHKSSGATVGASYWYEAEDLISKEKYDLTTDKKKNILKRTKEIREKINNSPYSSELELALVKYVKANDTRNYDTCFMKLWSTLEYLTSTLKDSYDKTIKRTSFHYKERMQNKTTLEHLRHYRNEFVHAGTLSDEDLKTHIYLLKGYVEHLIRFHLCNYFNFKSMKDASLFMDVPYDLEILRQDVVMQKHRLKYLGME